MRDVDLHGPVTHRRRHVELPNPVVHIPFAAHKWRVPNTYRTNTWLQSHTVNPHLPKKKTISPPHLEPETADPLIPKAPRNRRERRSPSSETEQNYGWAYSQRPPSTVWRNRTRHTYHVPVDRSISLRHLHALVSIHTSPTSPRGGPRATGHWPHSGNHPTHLLTIPHFGDELPTSLQIHWRVIVFFFSSGPLFVSPT